MKYLSILFLLIFTGCSTLKNVSHHEMIWQAAHVIDVAQTAQIAKNNNCFHEADPLTSRLIGKQPKESDVYIWGIASSIAHYFIFKFTDKKGSGSYGMPLRFVDNSHKLNIIRKNHKMGLRPHGLTHYARERCSRIENSQSINMKIFTF